MSDTSEQNQPSRPCQADQQRRAERAPEPDRLSPADRYQELFVAVQSGRIFDDSKTFVDCAPKGDPGDILKAYRHHHLDPQFDLAAFVAQHFDVVHPPLSQYQSQSGQALCAHIDSLWPVLTRHPREHAPHASMLQLPEPYVVPGGRFGEMYYWDSYFTMVGLAASGRKDLLGAMLANFSYLIDTYGHVPNGTRSYYLSRSQPPVFALMLELAEEQGAASASDHRDQLEQEHSYWMSGAEALGNGQAARRVVRLQSGGYLNRYWDDRDTPREESWLEDVATAGSCTREPHEVYRHLRAAAESGWDFSSRWLQEEPLPETDSDPSDGASSASQAPAVHSPSGHADPGSKSTAGSGDASASVSGAAKPNSTHPARGASSRALNAICTTDIVPVDLNAFLYKLESLLAQVCRAEGDTAAADDYASQALARRQAVDALCWDDEQGSYFDYNWRRRTRRQCLTAACLTPLFVGMASDAQAAAQAELVRRRLVAPGGLSTTECGSDQQWDRPNGWAPLQWIGIRGLQAYGHDGLARDIAHRWLDTVAEVYGSQGKLVEKYMLRETPQGRAEGGGGGEYPLQDGFGWTNGVTRALLAEHPQHRAHTVCSAGAAPRIA